jgi:septum formation protein
MLILGSRSPRRQDLLQAAGIEFRVVVPEVQAEPPQARRGRPADLVRRAALAKAECVARRERGIVLGADTIVVCDGEVMGKPRDPDHARQMLARLSGRWHSVYTGLALVRGARRLIGWERTKVAFLPLSNTHIAWYVSTGEPMDKAGAYAIQGEGAALIRAIRGCYTNVVGLPLPKLVEMLGRFETPAAPSNAARRGGR